MPWWGWLFLGALLVFTELMIVDFEFYLLLIGVAAIIVGVLDLSNMPWQPWVEWLAFVATALISVVVFRRRVYQKGRR